MLADIPVEDIKSFEAELTEYLVATKDALLATIRETGVLTDETTEELKEAINVCKAKFLGK
jgi:F0F1-type ATP synthase alpha subunit